MSSGTVGYTDYSQNSPRFNPIAAVMSRVIEARKLAKEEYEFAQKEADKYQTSLEEAGIPKGYFFKKALGYKFGGEFKDKTVAKLSDIKTKASEIKGAAFGKYQSKSERVNRFLDALEKKGTKVSFRDRFKDLYKDSFVDDPMLRPMSSLVKPGSAKRFKKAVFGDDGDLSKKKRIQKEDILRVIAELGDSLNQTAKSISDSTAEINTNLIKSFSIQNDLVNQIKVNGSSLEDRLDDIVKALTNQTQVQDKAVRDAKKTKTEDDLEEQSISSDVSSYDDLTTPEDETKEDRPRNMADDTASMKAYGFEKGGIVTGPKTGYPVTLHGTEAIIPLDNYATDNISGNEMTPGGNIKMAERGSGIKFTKVGRSTSSSRTSTGVSNISQDILDAQEIAVRSTGARLLSDSTQYLNTIGGGDPQTAANIQRMQAVVANKYDLPRSSVSISKNQQKSMSSFDLGKTGSGSKQKSKGLLESITDGISDFFKSFGGNNNPPPPTDPNDNPRSFKDIAGSYDQFSEQELSDLGRMIYAETGSDKLRAANVMNTILNRYRQIKSGTVSPGAWGIDGKTKEEVTLSDIIKAPSQYSPIDDGRFNEVTSDQGLEALNNAIAGGGLNPQEIYDNLLAAGVDQSTADTVSRADSFSNPTTRSVKPFPVPETGALEGLDPHSYQAAVDKTTNKRRQAFTPQTQPQTEVNKNAVATSDRTGNLGLSVGELSAEFKYKDQKFRVKRIDDVDGETRFTILADTGSNIFGVKDNVSSQKVGKEVWELIQRVSGGDLGRIKFGQEIDKPSTENKDQSFLPDFMRPEPVGGDQPTIISLNIGGAGQGASGTSQPVEDQTTAELSPNGNNRSPLAVLAS